MDKLTCIRTFIAVVETGSFTSAAKACGLSKALVSKYVNALESDLSVRLLQRTTRQVTITDSGRLYYQRSKPLLEDLNELDNAIKDAQENIQGVLKISAPVSFTEIKLMPIFQQFLEENPYIKIQLDLSDHYVNLLEQQVDVAIRIGNLEDSSLVARKLMQMNLVLCASPNYLKTHGQPRHPDELASHQIIFDSNNRNDKRWLFTHNGKHYHVTPSCKLEVNSARAVRELVIAGQGISLLPSFVVDEDIKAGLLIPLLGRFQSPSVGVYAVYQHRNHLPAKIRVLVNQLVKSFTHS